MKYLKIIGLVAVAAMALMAFGAGTASATKLYGSGVALGAGTEIKGSLTLTAELVTTEGTVLNQCTGSSMTGTTSNAGGSTETVKGAVATAGLTWSGCTNTVTTLEGGELEIHHITGTTNGTLTAKGFKVTVQTPFGSCVFTTGAGTHMGTLTGSTTGNSTMDINAVVTRETGLCPLSARWKATYVTTSPTKLTVEAS
jgi:hypothetical protein